LQLSVSACRLELVALTDGDLAGQSGAASDVQSADTH